MLKTCTLVLALLTLALPVQAQEERHLTMTGTARIDVMPDITRARGGIYVEGDSATETLKRAERQVATLAETMKAFGPVAVTRIALGQDRTKSTRLIGSGDAGFAARGTVTVTLTDPARAGEALDAFVGAGVEGVAYLFYDTADRTPLIRQAREEAVADAMDRAETYAEAAGLILGPISELSETSSQSGSVHSPEAYGARSSYGAKGAAGPETLTIAASVTIRWALQ